MMSEVSETNRNMGEHLYKAVARNAYGDIVQGSVVSISSEREIDFSTGLSFRHEIAEACRQQLGVAIGEGEEARLAANFDVYSEQRYEESVRPKLEAAAEKEHQRQQREAEKAARKEKASKGKASKKSATSSVSVGKLTTAQWKRLLKFLIAAVVIIWFVSSQLKSCTLSDLATQARETAEQMTKTSKTTTKKSATSKKKSSASKKKATTRKSTSTTKKSSSATKKTATKKSSSTSKKTATSAAKKKTSATSSKKKTSSTQKKSSSSKKTSTSSKKK